MLHTLAYGGMDEESLFSNVMMSLAVSWRSSSALHRCI